MPALVVCGVAVAGLLVAWRGRTGVRLWVAVAGAVAIWTATQVVAIGPSPPRDAEPTLRVMMWNMFNDHLTGPNAERLTDLFAATQPDVVLLIEAGLGHDAGGYSADGWRRRAPGYEPDWLRNRFMQLTRTGRPAAERLPDLDLPVGGYSRVLRLAVTGAAGESQPITVILLHPNSQPTWDRSAVFAAACEQVLAYADAGPTIFCGDLNLPAESSHLDPLRGAMRRAAAAAPGWHFLPTWPTPVPVLTLDQFWVSEHFAVHAATSPYTLASDHQPVVVDLSLR